MGYAARQVRVRECPSCHGVLYATSEGLHDHAILCKRITALGLIPPGIQKPDMEAPGD